MFGSRLRITVEARGTCVVSVAVAKETTLTVQLSAKCLKTNAGKPSSSWPSGKSRRRAGALRTHPVDLCWC